MSEKGEAYRMEYEKTGRMESLEALPGAIAVFSRDIQGTLSVEYFSNRAREVTGNKERPVSDMEEILRTVCGEDRERVRKCLERSFAEAENLDIEYRITGKDGMLRWIHQEANAVPGTDGGCKFYTCYTDVTPQKEAEKLQNATLSGIARGCLVMYRINLEEDSYMKIGSMKEVDSVVSRFCSAQEAMNAVIAGVVRAEYQKDMYAFADLHTLPERLKDRTLITCDYQGSLSGWCCAEFIPIAYDAFGRVREVIYAVQHIQDRKMESYFYQKALESHSVFVYYFDLTEGILYENFGPVASRLVHDFSEYTFPMRYDDFIGRAYDTIKAVKIDDEEFRFTRAELLKKHAGGESLIRVRYYSEAYDRYFNDRYLLIKNEKNGHVMAVVVGTDITEEYRREMANIQAIEAAMAEAKRANQAKTDFLARMSHDIRTPINGIVGLIYLIEQQADQREVVVDGLKKMKKLSEQLDLLVSDILEVSRIETGKITLTHECFDLVEMLEQNIAAFRVTAEKNHIAIADVDKTVLHSVVQSSPVHVQRVLMNVLSNAVKYNRPGGRITCSLKETELDNRHSNYCIMVKDTGIGMSEAFQDMIFEPFSMELRKSSSDYSGTGLGMVITKEFVDRLGGTIRIRSREDVGTTVEIHLPLEVRRRIPDEKRTVWDTDSLSGKRILIVDDNQVNTEVLKFMLEETGVAVETVENGKEALEAFEQKPEFYFDMILMDMRMPVMNGTEATKRIRCVKRRDAGRIPILAISANAFEEDVRECREAGMNDHIAKPIRIDEVIPKIRKFLHLYSRHMQDYDV